MPEVARQAREVLGIGSSGAFSAACLSMGITLQSDRPPPRAALRNRLFYKGFSTLLDVWSVLLDVSPFLLDVWSLLLDVSEQGQKHAGLQWFPARSLRAPRFE